MSVVIFLLVLGAATLHAAWNVAAKKVAGNLGVLWLGLCLASILSWPCVWLVWKPTAFSPQGLLYMTATTLLHAAYFFLLARSYEVGEISLVYPVARGTGVAGTALIATIGLHEPLTLYGVTGIGAICIGTMLVGFSTLHHKDGLTAYRQALLVGCTIMGYSVVDKLGVQHVHPIVYISAMFTLAALLLAPYVWRQRRATLGYAYTHFKRYVALIGIGSISTYLIILFAFRLGHVSYIVAAREFAVVVGSVLGILLLNERLTARKLLGIAAITGGLVLVKLA